MEKTDCCCLIYYTVLMDKKMPADNVKADPESIITVG